MPYTQTNEDGRKHLRVTGLSRAEMALAARDVENSPNNWATLIEGMLRVRDPDLCDRVEFNAEANVLGVSADTDAAFGFVQRNIDELESDAKLMVRCAEHAFPSCPLPVWHS